MDAIRQEIHQIVSSLPDAIRDGLAMVGSEAAGEAVSALKSSGLIDPLATCVAATQILDGENRLHVMAGFASQMDDSDLAMWLVRRAVVVGEAKAVNQLEAYLAAKTFPASEVIILDGVRVEGPIEIAKSVSLKPIDDLQPTPYRNIFRGRNTLPMPRDRTALVREFLHPILVTDGESPHPSEATKIARDERLRDIARLLALHPKTAPVVVARWWEHGPEIPSMINTGASVGYGFEQGFHETLIKKQDAAVIREWINLAEACPPRVWQTLRIVLERLGAAKRRRHTVDRAIELGIAMEALFLRQPGEDQSELSFRLASRAAWMLGSSAPDRRALYALFRALYDARCKAVHNGKVPETIKGRPIGELLDDGCEKVVDAVISTLRDPELDLLHVHLG